MYMGFQEITFQIETGTRTKKNKLCSTEYFLGTTSFLITATRQLPAAWLKMNHSLRKLYYNAYHMQLQLYKEDPYC